MMKPQYSTSQENSGCSTGSLAPILFSRSRLLVRFDGAYSRGDSDMDIGALETTDWDDLEPELQKVFYEAQIAGINGEDYAPPPTPDGDPLS